MPDKNDDNLLIKCPECHKENYAQAVYSGQCVWCGYKKTEAKDDR